MLTILEVVNPLASYRHSQTPLQLKVQCSHINIVKIDNEPMLAKDSKE